MVSFVVKLLYTNVLIKDCLDVIERRIKDSDLPTELSVFT